MSNSLRDCRKTLWLLSIVVILIVCCGPVGRACARTISEVARRSEQHALSRLDESFLDHVQRAKLRYFLECAHPVTGLFLDRTRNDRPPSFDEHPATIAGTGFGLSAFIVGVERGWLCREEALERTRRSLRWLYHRQPHVRGFFYHFLNPHDGARVWDCELSSVDTALALNGILLAGEYYGDEELKELATALYERVDWAWMTNGREHLCMGWKPEEGFLPHYWEDYAEQLSMYLLAIGSPTHPISANAWQAIVRPVGSYGGYTLMSCPPLFTHQYSHLWVDFRGQHDGMADYFANSVAATLANRQFCIDAAPSWTTFGPNSWGLSACMGPDGYLAYGAPPGPTTCDGTVAPTAAGGSLAFTPRESIAALRHFYGSHFDRLWGRYGFADAFNLDRDWFDTDAYAINQGAIILAAENLRSQLIWNYFERLEALQRAKKLVGLRPGSGPPLATGLGEPVVWRPFLPHVRPELEVPVRTADRLPVTLDDPAWADTPVIHLTTDQLQRGWTVDRRWNARIHLAASQELLRLAMVVEDPTPHPAPDPDRPWEGDCIEIFIDGGNDGFSWQQDDDAQIIVAPDANRGINCRLIIGGSHQEGGNGMIVASRIDRAGWAAIVDLPRDRFPMGETIGFCPVGTDVMDEVTAPSKYAWFWSEPGIHLGSLSFRRPGSRAHRRRR